MPAFQFGLTLAVPYTTIGEVAGDQLLGRRLAVRDGVVIRIDALGLEPAGDRVRVVVDFGVEKMKRLPMKPSGRLEILGEPRYHPDGQRIAIERLELDLSTDHVVARLADAVLHDAIRDRLARALDMPVGHLLDDAARRLEDVALGEHGRIHCSTVTLRPGAIDVGAEALEATLVVEGRGVLTLTPPPLENAAEESS